MEFTPDRELNDFRLAVREAIAEDLPADIAQRQKAWGGISSGHEDSLRWTKIMNRRGWSVPHWPEEYGGTGWSAIQKYIFEEERAAAWAPETCWTATHMCGPVIYTFGSEDMKERFLPGLRDGSYWVAQGFSEPSNGSDLARLRTRAERRGDIYLVNGQKIWTSGAYASKWGFFLVRTNAEVKPQAGISFLMIDLESPGITIRQIPQINDEADLCEVFLDNVEVPVENLVGEENRGWDYAKFLLDHERTTSSFIFANKNELKRCKYLAEHEVRSGKPLIEDPVFRRKLASIEADVMALEWSVLRDLAQEEFAYGTSAAASTLKVSGSLLQQSLSELQVDILGPKAMRRFDFEPDLREDTGDAWPEYVGGRTLAALILRASTIYGGTLQVQKGIISKLAFNL